MLQRKIITTADGSKTIQIEDWNEQYHSVHGAIQEANHVYIKHGLLFCLNEQSSTAIEEQLDTDSNAVDTSLSILEIGFGTGLNAFLTLLKAEELQMPISYVGVEAYPISTQELKGLNYVEQLQVPEMASVFDTMHLMSWREDCRLSPYFKMEKQQKRFEEINAKNQFDLIYFDAFGARVQPELWTSSIFKIMFDALEINGTLVTYAAKGSVRRAMQEVGFEIEKLPGPPGKREMLRARKLDS